MRCALFASLCLFLCACGATNTSAGRSDEMKQHSIVVGGTTRHFLIFSPSSVLHNKTRPLIIALHGGGTNGESMARFSALNQKAQQAGFIVVYPDGSGRFSKVLTWNAGACCGYARENNINDVQFISELIDELVAHGGVDAARVYVTGMSNGAMMAYRLAAEIPEKIAAVAAVAGTLGVPPSAIHAPMPILHFHGTADQHVPYTGGHGPKSAAGNVHRSVDETINTWIAVNHANRLPSVTPMPDMAKDGMTVTRYSHASASDPHAVVLYKIIGGGHTWPGQPRLERLLGPTTQDISANDLMWEFFVAHPKAGK